ncbi:MAG: HD-GYP domain-containing protein, partial [Eubacterium sp.]|nr:HD-GYP domain-containing protein [Eubacterium sp.]
MYIVFIRRFSKNTAVLYLSQMLVVVGVWLLSESHLRQLIFTAPSFSSIFSYTSIELIGFYVACYFDEVQSKKYHSVFTFLKTVMVIQIIVNAYLDFASIASFYDTLWFSHLWMVLGIFICFVTIGIDAYKKRVKNYSITCIGMISLVVSAFIEIICFYVLSFYSLGVVLSIGLIIMLICTMIQVIYDELKATKERALRQRKQTITTIETIANTIDAKDKYTGGHSERVGEYAGILAEAVSGEFGFTPDDVKRITYIGKMHDIGKIGIPDRILNKAGRLSDEEFDKMKEHVTIGRDLLSNLDDIEGLKEGVLYHHERFDGKGYPSGLEGENIPVIARILCIADSYDAMTSNRVYRGRLSDEEVLSELKVCSGTQFDPDLCSAFIDLINSKKIVPIV